MGPSNRGEIPGRVPRYRRQTLPCVLHSSLAVPSHHTHHSGPTDITLTVRKVATHQGLVSFCCLGPLLGLSIELSQALPGLRDLVIDLEAAAVC